MFIISGSISCQLLIFMISLLRLLFLALKVIDRLNFFIFFVKVFINVRSFKLQRVLDLECFRIFQIVDKWLIVFNFQVRVYFRFVLYFRFLECQRIQVDVRTWVIAMVLICVFMVQYLFFLGFICRFFGSILRIVLLELSKLRLERFEVF